MFQDEFIVSSSFFCIILFLSANIFKNAKEYGSILDIKNINFDELFNDITNEQYSKGCDMLQCGYGYSEDGLHPCSIGMALNRILKLRTGYANKQECDKNKADYLAATCKMCGLFKKLGSHNVDKSQFTRVTENAYSKSWEFMKQFK